MDYGVTGIDVIALIIDDLMITSSLNSIWIVCLCKDNSSCDIKIQFNLIKI